MLRKRHPAERVIAVLMAAAMLWVCFLIGPREYVYALGHLDETPYLWFPPLILGLAVWCAATPRRAEGPPILAISLGLLGGVALAGAAFMVAMAEAFRH